MNILQILNEELKNKNWSLEEKERYLYLRSCQLFTFDTRYYFLNPNMNSLKINNSISLLDTINNEEIDLKNVTDNRVNCRKWSKAYKKMLEELLDVHAECVENLFEDHAFVSFGHKADATTNSDLTRVKMHLDTLGYELSTSKEKFLYDNKSDFKIKAMDKNIGYIEESYWKVDKIIDRLQEKSKNSDLDFTSSFFFWMNRLQDTYHNLSSCVKYLEDASFSISYLFRHFFSSEFYDHLLSVTLFDDSRDFWNFVVLYKINHLENAFYYALIQEDSLYNFREISYQDIIHYTNSLKGYNKELLLKK